jgi:hypothetical protein
MPLELDGGHAVFQNHPVRIAGLLLLLLSLLASSVRAVPAEAPIPPEDAAGDSTVAAPSGSKFIDPSDGWFDVSAFLDTGHGFVPVAVPVTEPAVGYGVGGALVFIRRNEPLEGGGYRKPNMLALGGMGTENGTWATFAGHTGSWDDDRIQTLVVGIYGSINLDFYGIGDGPLNDHPVGYGLEPAGGLAQVRYRIGRSRAQIGLAYGFAAFDVSFDAEAPPEQVDPSELESRIGGLVPSLVLDSRDNAFTPTGGIYVDASTGLFREWLGGTSDFERINVTGLFYQRLATTLFLGARVDAASSFGEAPFYARPFITLRGAPVMRYLGENAASVELEARWQFYRRISIVGFGGAGSAWNDFGHAQDQENILTGGGGLRYELARRYGLHMGFDLAWGPDENALYIQFGNAWFRP